MEGGKIGYGHVQDPSNYSILTKDGGTRLDIYRSLLVKLWLEIRSKGSWETDRAALTMSKHTLDDFFAIQQKATTRQHPSKEHIFQGSKP
jgi:hypothetical protein